jgi:hypothetical protein
MALAVETEYRGGTTEQYDETIKAMGLTAGGRHPGALFHWVTKTDSGIRVTDVWESREEWERFLHEQVIPVGTSAGLPAPEESRYFDVHNYLVGQ